MLTLYSLHSQMQKNKAKMLQSFMHCKINEPADFNKNCQANDL